MKLTSITIAPIVVVILAGGIALSAAMNLWKTTSDKIPARYKSGEFAGTYDPGDIRGSYSFSDIEASFEIPAEDLARAFGFGAEENPGALRAKDLETVYGEVDGGEIGTDSLRYFVALYSGKPYVPNDDTLLPAPAVSVLRDRLSETALAEVRKRVVSLSGSGAPAATEHSESSDDQFVRGRTTFGELKSWGLSKEEIEKAIGMEMGKPGETVRDLVAGAGKEFSGAKARLQEIIDSK